MEREALQQIMFFLCPSWLLHNRDGDTMRLVGEEEVGVVQMMGIASLARGGYI